MSAQARQEACQPPGYCILQYCLQRSCTSSLLSSSQGLSVCYQHVPDQKVILTGISHVKKCLITYCIQVYVDTDLLQTGLCCLCVYTKLGTACVDNKIKNKRISVRSFYKSVTVNIFVSGLIKDLLCAVRIIGILILQIIESKVKCWRNRCFTSCCTPSRRVLQYVSLSRPRRSAWRRALSLSA